MKPILHLAYRIECLVVSDFGKPTHTRPLFSHTLLPTTRGRSPVSTTFCSKASVKAG